MRCTEAEAKQKWCPFARGTLYMRGDGDEAQPINVLGHGMNRVTTDDPAINERIGIVIEQTGITRCLGTKCMAWNWAEPDTWVDPQAPERRGFCGIAGAGY